MEFILSWFIGIILFVWLMRLLLPLLMPLVLRWIVKRLHGKATFMSNFGAQNFRPEQEEEQQKPAESEKIVGDDIGEYVDFEEIDKK